MAFRIHPDCTQQPVGEDLIVLNTRSGRYFRLNATGRTVLGVIAAGGDQAAMAARLTETYEVTESRAKADVAALLERMLELELLKRDG